MKPLFEPEYCACTIEVTVQEVNELAAVEVTPTALPVVAGWLFQVTPVSVQAPPDWYAFIVREPPVALTQSLSART